jgi:hypothetical protein
MPLAGDTPASDVEDDHGGHLIGVGRFPETMV